MQHEFRDNIETYLSEDALVSLGAIRMALTWVIDDLAEAGISPAGLRRVENELTALQDRTKVICRGLRGAEPAGARHEATQSSAPLGAQGSVPTSVRVSEPVADVHSLEDTLVMRPRDGCGLPPKWLTDLDSTELLNMEGHPEDELAEAEEKTALSAPDETALEPQPSTDPNPHNGSPNIGHTDQTSQHLARGDMAGADLGDSIEALLTSALAGRDEKKIGSSNS